MQEMIYISGLGPMSGLPNYNYGAFFAAENLLRSQGKEVINPAKHFGGDQGRARSDYIRADVAVLLRKATAIYMLKGWHNSAGARLERELAIQLDLPVTYAADAEKGEPVETHAQQLVRNGARQAVYGPPRRDFSRTAKIWSGILGTDVTPEDVALCMVGLKMSRLKATPDHGDSIVDSIGYMIAYSRLGEGE